MNNKQLHPVSRILLAICGILLILVLFVPLWRIDLIAPQYPEGLRLLIYPHELAGNVDIINGLNHYIGMKTLHTTDFIEFRVLPYLVVFFALAFILTATLGRKKYLYLLLLLFICFGIISMYDFWRWEYNYGHNLRPDAAIVVPGMSYQPPLLGFKQLLNFGAYSFPDIGGWIFLGVGLISFILAVTEWRQQKSIVVKSMLFIFSLSCLASCNSGPEKIIIGTDHCSACKMRITEPQYGGELITAKGKVYKFDDVVCLKSFLTMQDKASVKYIYLILFSGNHELIDAHKAVLVESPSINGPMGGKMAVFEHRDSITAELKNNGSITNWNEFVKP